MKSAKKCVESVGIEPTNELGWLHLFARRLSCASLYLKTIYSHEPIVSHIKPK